MVDERPGTCSTTAACSLIGRQQPRVVPVSISLLQTRANEEGGGRLSRVPRDARRLPRLFHGWEGATTAEYDTQYYGDSPFC
jgi:hypothetical protein